MITTFLYRPFPLIFVTLRGGRNGTNIYVFKCSFLSPRVKDFFSFIFMLCILMYSKDWFDFVWFETCPQNVGVHALCSVLAVGGVPFGRGNGHWHWPRQRLLAQPLLHQSPLLSVCHSVLGVSHSPVFLSWAIYFSDNDNNRVLWSPI